MKKLQKVLFGVVAALAVAAVAPRWAAASEAVRPQHPAVQVVLSSTAYVGAVSSTTASVDLAGGDYTKIGCAFYIRTATSSGTPTLDAAIQISPDGGTNWVTAGSFTQVTSTVTSVGTTYLKNGVDVIPGTKARMKFTGSANTNWQGVVAWCMPTYQ